MTPAAVRPELSYHRIALQNDVVAAPTPVSAKHIILLRHWEQMSNALNSLKLLAWFTASWKARVVEPFIQNDSHFFHGFNDTKNSYPMSTIFNTTKINENLHRHGIPPLTTYNDFLKHGAKDILLISIIYDGHKQRALNWSKKSNKYDNCKNSVCKGHSNNLLETMNRASKPDGETVNYKVVRCCCIYGLEPTSRRTFTEKCGISDATTANYSIVFTDWRGISATGGGPRLFSPEFALEKDSLNNLTYPYSQSVKEGAMNFLESVSTITNEKHPVLLVHIRSEKILDKYSKDAFNDCIKDMLKRKESILSSTNKSYIVAYMSDIGKYGSKSCFKKDCLQMMMDASKKYNFELISYDPRKFGGVDNPMFVAAVEQEMMSMADILILVGGGSYQHQLHQRFLSKHNYPNASYVMCM